MLSEWIRKLYYQTFESRVIPSFLIIFLYIQVIQEVYGDEEGQHHSWESHQDVWCRQGAELEGSRMKSPAI